ncbi:MAG: MFS transporter [Bacteroidota bacterium]|nr:MFS transporter [Bacteroidota bacterium]
MQQKTTYSILWAIAIAHLFNDLIQAVIPAVYPQLQKEFNLSMAQIGRITLCYQIAASVFQPLVGFITDKHPMPFSQIGGMLFSFVGIILLSFAPSYEWILVAVIVVGIGSSIFHPESSRVAYLASGGKRSMAQSVFQLGGNAGTAIAPLLIVWIIIPNHRSYIAWFGIIVLLAKILLYYVGKWRTRELKNQKNKHTKTIVLPNLTQKQIFTSIFILLLLIFSKYFYTVSITNYFQFYLIETHHFSETTAQLYLFYFLIASAFGTLLGGIFGDRIGRKFVIWFSILGVAPLSLLLPYLPTAYIAICIVFIGLIISSAFPAILVYAQELLPHKIGMISGLFYGLAFGMAGIAAAVLGNFIDQTSITYVYQVCSYLPLIGLVAYFLPNLKNI